MLGILMVGATGLGGNTGWCERTGEGFGSLGIGGATVLAMLCDFGGVGTGFCDGVGVGMGTGRGVGFRTAFGAG